VQRTALESGGREGAARRTAFLLIFGGARSGWRRGDLMGFASGRSLDYFGCLFFRFFLFAATSVSVSHVQ